MKRAVVFTLVTLLITDSFLRGEISAGRSAPNAPCHIVQQAMRLLRFRRYPATNPHIKN